MGEREMLAVAAESCVVESEVRRMVAIEEPATEVASAAPVHPVLPRTPWNRMPVLVRDLIIFVVLGSFAFAPFGGITTTAWVKAFLVAQALLVVVLRRRWPMIALVVASALFVVTLLLGVANAVPTFAVAVALFAFAEQAERRLTLIAGVGTLVVLLLATLLFDRAELLDPRAISLVTIMLTAVALAEAARSRRDYILAITERALRAERTRESEAQRRVAEDRLRIARDLHDVVAHQIAVINLHAGVASSSLRSAPEAAEESLSTIRHASRAVLAEIGDLLAMLRAGSGEAAGDLVPLGGVTQVDTLISGFADVGLQVRTEVEGSLAELPPAVDLVAYRVIQEGLTNAHKHGTGSAALTVRRDGSVLDIRVRNPRRSVADDGGANGYGLQGLRERVESVRGTTQVDASDAKTFELGVTIPLPGPERSALA